MSTVNGANHHNVEDILASIRSTISDEPPTYRAQQASLNAQRSQSMPRQAVPIRRELSVAEEASEFELPAIFKPGHQSTQVRPNILGRLTEALKPQAEAEPERSRTVVRFEPAASQQARMIEPPQAAPAAAPADRSAEKVERQNEQVKRVMPTFFDTRMTRMSETAREPAKPVEQPAPQQPVAAAPPRLPDPSAGDPTMEDAAAQLLRPILQQWLSDNMPKIVERALRTDGPGDAPQAGPHDVRKTLR